MDTIDRLIRRAQELGASDLHLEPGTPPTLRIRGGLQSRGEPLSATVAADMAHQLIGEAGWSTLQQQCSFDMARTIGGVRCRVNAMQTMRGVGLAVRLLPASLPTIDGLNLHPDLAHLSAAEHGLLLVSGPTGSGKSSTLAAMLQEINRTTARHIVTIEQPIEFALRPHRSLIRQREVGRDTPSFDQALRDCLREDPDVIMVGELREPETIRLTLNAAETGHLVLATLHSATVVEALQRVVHAVAPEIQASVAAQLADCLRAVVCQRLRYNEAIDLRIPECEILTASSGARALIRQRELHKLGSVLETGAAEGMWSWERYRRWLESRDRWHRPRPSAPPNASTSPASDDATTDALPGGVAVDGIPDRFATETVTAPSPSPTKSALPAHHTEEQTPAGAARPEASGIAPSAPGRDTSVLVIDDHDDDPAEVLRELERRRRR